MGVVTTMQVLKAPAGNERMRDIASAVQEGARAYLARQYRTIAIVGVVVVALVYLFPGTGLSDRLPDRRAAVGPDRLRRHERFGEGQCAHRRGGPDLAPGRPDHGVSLRRDHRDAGRRPRPARDLGLLLLSDGGRRPRAQRPHRRRRTGRPGLWRIADFDLRASWRRYLHQGRRRRRRPRRQGRGRNSRGRSPQSRDHRR